MRTNKSHPQTQISTTQQGNHMAIVLATKSADSFGERELDSSTMTAIAPSPPMETAVSLTSTYHLEVRNDHQPQRPNRRSSMETMMSAQCYPGDLAETSVGQCNHGADVNMTTPTLSYNGKITANVDDSQHGQLKGCRKYPKKSLLRAASVAFDIQPLRPSRRASMEPLETDSGDQKISSVHDSSPQDLLMSSSLHTTTHHRFAAGQSLATRRLRRAASVTFHPVVTVHEIRCCGW